MIGASREPPSLVIIARQPNSVFTKGFNIQC